MKLVDDWKQAWRWSSVHAMTAAAAVQGAWMAMPEGMKQHIPTGVATGLTLSLLVLGVVGRLRDQTKSTKREPE